VESQNQMKICLPLNKAKLPVMPEAFLFPNYTAFHIKLPFLKLDYPLSGGGGGGGGVGAPPPRLTTKKTKGKKS
jgi:hypothetical protein